MYRGCCSDDYVRLIHLDVKLHELRDEACSLMKRHAEIRKTVKEAG